KQILILTIFVAAILAGTSNGFAQTVGGALPYENVLSGLPTCLTPQAFTNGVCTSNALHPVQGTGYDYTVTTNSGDFVRWFVVNNNDLAPETPANDSLVSSISGILPIADGNIDPSNGLGQYIYG